MRRRAGAGTVVISALAASLLVFPFLVASQQEHHHYRKPPHEHGPLVDQHTRSGRHEVYGDGRQLEAPDDQYLEDTSLDPDGTSDIATTAAPAGIDRAVRALRPVRGSSKHAGISSPQSARSLQDWEVEDFVLLVTVDGSIHARDRKTGIPRWELEVDRPMVETTYYPQNKSNGEDSKPEYDFLWIVEPSRDGDIYVYNQRGNGLQRLHMTVKELAEDMSPYESIDPAVVYNAEKKTKLYTVDAATGSITKVFGSVGASGKSHLSCPKPRGLESIGDECPTGSSFVLGRTEYTITIQNRDTTEPICTLTYSEWGPNTRDEDLHSQYSTTMDQKYVYALHDGSIFGLDYTQMVNRQKSYTQKLSSPVVRVFDVVRPLAVEERDPQLIVLQQPVGPVDNEYKYNAFNDRNRIFVNHTEAGGWFAMSESTYPLVTGKARHAQCYDKNWLESNSAKQPLSAAQLQEAFVGVHDISELETWRGSGLTISGPSEVAENVDQAQISVYVETPSLPSLLAIGKSRIIRSAATNFTDIVIALIVIIMFTFLGINRRFLGKVLKQNLDLKNVFPATEQPLTSVPSSPLASHGPWTEEPLPAPIDQVEAVLEKRSDDGTPILLEPPPNISRSRAGSLEEDRGRKGIEHGVRFEERSPAPEDEDGPHSPQPGKKKARRGVRGGVKHRKKRSNSKHEQNDKIEQTVQEVMQIAQEPPIEPDISKVNGNGATSMTEVCGSAIQIGHLKVYTDTVLGFGSHGTMVYRGSFGGRDVAVKRMLLEFYEIASHEVSLLQESDDHPNVIRYFDKESAGEFLYIALELCPASLQDVIEKPFNFPSLIGPQSLDLPDALRQITAGLQYLHSLKIVHRDIKPQNILVSAPKKIPLNPSSTLQPPRLLISDFGLCKKLEGDQNSFRATTAHAAGTSGWRAPELLVDEDLASSILHPDQASAHTAGSTSEPAVVDPQTNRRATRAIDVFSLGCVFYYVLTSGNHPFDKDGKYMREANIVKGHYNLDDLASLGDYQWEAKDLISSMIAHNPRHRPDAATVLQHPFFWPADDRLDFLCHVSDGFEFEPRDPPSEALLQLESHAPEILAEASGDFLRVLPPQFRDTLGKQRKYTGGRVLDLLRALRNKKNHYEDMPESLKEKIGGLPAGYLGFWTCRFPVLLMACQRVVLEVGWEGRDRFRRFYGGI